MVPRTGNASVDLGHVDDNLCGGGVGPSAQYLDSLPEACSARQSVDDVRRQR